MDLRIAVDKTEIIILRAPRATRDQIHFGVGGQTISPNKTVRYLGVNLDDRMTFSKHVEAAVAKAEERTSALPKILPNEGGLGSQRRRVTLEVIHSIILYGAPVCRAYRTVSAIALHLIAGAIPIHVIVDGRVKIHKRVQTDRK
ncbi:uncharacterized protein LOC130893006 [Diorhabda carinulata]|uniref:uncharacterized protein LOC130893006 n=1 Tax=Diorhabda carinulata TaxID=1163345 RepID=UPI0025A1FE64|nr:uncharacterized protein LOC130893006 [Diorhabda carinulata]